eukprot:1161941-Pelagomonas_calceolata.AAC.2
MAATADLQNALKMMSKQKSGRIVNVTSVVGLVGNAGQVLIWSFGLIGADSDWQYAKHGLLVLRFLVSWKPEQWTTRARF